MDLINDAIHSLIEQNSTYDDEFESEDDYDYCNDDDDDDYSSVDSAITEEKAYVCDYDTIYVCLYEELEEYRTSKQAKKKNTTSSWNNLLVVTPDGGVTNMKKAPIILSKVVKKPMTDNQKSDKIESFKLEPKIEEPVKQKTIPVSITNNNNHTKSHVPEVKASKSVTTEPGKQKLSKKKLKKQRQKEKKKGEKKGKPKEEEEVETNGEEMAEDPEDEEAGDVTNEDRSRSESKAESLESAQNEIYDQENENDDEASADIDLSGAVIPAFVSNALKKNEKKILMKKEEKPLKTSQKANKKTVVEQKSVEKKTVQKPISVNGDKLSSVATAIPDISSANAQPSVDPEFDFAVKKIKRLKATGNEYQEAISLGKEAYKLIMCERISQAVQFLSEAILVNSYDLRHFLNRSFCYLRLGAYNLALKDAQVVIKYTSERDEFIKAKFRSGQAFCGLQNFEEAEKYLDEAYNFSQADPHIHRELMRVRILQLLYMGFRERDILDAFKERSSIAEVVSILAEKTIVDEDDDCGYDSECNDDDIYNSDCEENPSFTRMLSNILKYQPGVVKKQSTAPSSPLKISTLIPQMTTVAYRKSVLTEVKKIISTVPPKPVVASKVFNDKAIWVGNTIPEVTDNMLRKRFTRFGKIVSIFRKPTEAYTFINFESAKAVTELLSSTSVVEVDGYKLPIKAATRAK